MVFKRLAIRRPKVLVYSDRALMYAWFWNILVLQESIERTPISGDITEASG